MVDFQKLGLRFAGCNSENTITRFETDDVTRGLDNFTGEFQSGYVW